MCFVFTFGLVRPLQCSAHRCSLPSLPSLERHQHRPDETTDCSCHHTGPSPPGYKEQGDGVFRGKKCHSKLGRPASRHSGRLPLTASVPALGPLAQQLTTECSCPTAKQPRPSHSSGCACFGVDSECCPVAVSTRALHQHPSHLPGAGMAKAGGAREGKKGRTRVSSRKGRRPRTDG